LVFEFLYRSPLKRYGWFGNYKTWEEAKKNSTGYDADVIIEKVKNAILKVRNGEAAYERDSVLFDKIEYSWPLLSGLMLVSSLTGRINVLDFGGSLGSTYFQNLKFLTTLRNVQWNIVEQLNFVEIGKELLEDNVLKFYPSIEECLRLQTPNTVILSGVLQYLEEPYQLLQSIHDLKIEFLILDRVPFYSKRGQDRITVQKVPPRIYKASYPAWFFNELKMTGFLSERYDLIEIFNCNDRANIPSKYKGMILKRKP
jgi:putative methyltransferase (TIGR04325 family)